MKSDKSKNEFRIHDHPELARLIRVLPRNSNLRINISPELQSRLREFMEQRTDMSCFKIVETALREYFDRHQPRRFRGRRHRADNSSPAPISSA